jgi:hypothetical protein
MHMARLSSIDGRISVLADQITSLVSLVRAGRSPIPPGH